LKQCIVRVDPDIRNGFFWRIQALMCGCTLYFREEEKGGKKKKKRRERGEEGKRISRRRNFSSHRNLPITTSPTISPHKRREKKEKGKRWRKGEKEKGRRIAASLSAGQSSLSRQALRFTTLYFSIFLHSVPPAPKRLDFEKKKKRREEKKKKGGRGGEKGGEEQAQEAEA